MTCTLSVIRSFKFGALGSVAKVKRNGLSRSRLLLISEAGAGGSVFSDLQPVSKTTLNESTTAAEIAGCLRCMAKGLSPVCPAIAEALLCFRGAHAGRAGYSRRPDRR